MPVHAPVLGLSPSLQNCPCTVRSCFSDLAHKGASVSMTMYVTLCLWFSVSLIESVCIPVSVSFRVCAHTSVPVKEAGTGSVCVGRG